MAPSGTILAHSTTYFRDRPAAEKIADANMRDEDDGTTYRVEQIGARFAIGVYDADGAFVFYL